MNHSPPAPSVRLSNREYNDLEGIDDLEPEKELYCLRYLEPQLCSCGLVLRYATSMHRIIVFDSPMSSYITNPAPNRPLGELVPYVPALGPCVTYEEFVAEGRPTHKGGK